LDLEVLVLVLLFLGCVSEEKEEAGDSEFSGDQTEGTQSAIVVQGEVTWSLDFNDDAEAEGFFDCEYSRSYEGVQYLDMPYLCADCDVQVEGLAVMDDNLDCYSQISSDPQTERTEYWGFGQTSFHRASMAQAPLGEIAELDGVEQGVPISLAWESEYSIGENGSFALIAAGEMSYSTDESIQIGTGEGASPAEYACGWPKNDPGDLPLDYHLSAGSVFPNVQLEDQCGELLSLWDLYGYWIILDSSQPDCGPCRMMASGAEAFVDELAEEGIDAVVVSLLGAGLSEPYATPDSQIFTDWVTEYSLQDPVLYDRGFAYALFPGFIEDYSGDSFGFPTWLVVDPEMTLVHGNVGFSSWDDVKAVIAENSD
jgi:hypothetical protein